MMDQATLDAERRLELYRQNSDNFRSLNAQMWQIPIIGMTLTGGLWFGVSNVKGSPFFQMSLLALAFVGNIALVLVLFRLRFVMGAYLDWLERHDADGRIDGNGPRLWQRSGTVRTVFQFVLGTAAAISLALLIATGLHAWGERTKEARPHFYERYARAMADEFEVPEFSTAHPGLQEFLVRSPRLTILDVGSGWRQRGAAFFRAGSTVPRRRARAEPKGGAERGRGGDAA